MRNADYLGKENAPPSYYKLSNCKLLWLSGRSSQFPEHRVPHTTVDSHVPVTWYACVSSMDSLERVRSYILSIMFTLSTTVNHAAKSALRVPAGQPSKSEVTDDDIFNFLNAYGTLVIVSIRTELMQ